MPPCARSWATVRSGNSGGTPREKTTRSAVIIADVQAAGRADGDRAGDRLDAEHVARPAVGARVAPA